MLIGFDLATRKTGICVLDKTDNKISVKYKDTLILTKFSQETLQQNTNNILNVLNSLKIKFNIKAHDKIFVEYNSGFTNTTACGLYAGLILSIFPQTIFLEAPAWQSLLFEKNYIQKIKEIGKEAFSPTVKIKWTKIWALEKFQEITNNQYANWGDDEIDAFWIAFLGVWAEPTFATTKMLRAGLKRSMKSKRTIKRNKKLKEKQNEKN